MKHNFKDAYGTLQRHAQTLREQTEPNIDDLLQIVEESVQAYKTCQSRIDAVEKALDKALANAQSGAPARAVSVPKPASVVSSHFDDEDGIPF